MYTEGQTKGQTYTGGKADSFDNCLFIFHRDFRITDNIGLNLANSKAKHIYPIFIFTPEQVTSTNKFKSDNAVQFMIESLEDLNAQIRKMSGGKLLTFYGHNLAVVGALIDALDIQLVCYNVDYSPYAMERDIELIHLCNKRGINIDFGHDYYLHPPGTITNGSGDTYQKFTPFYEASVRKKVDAPASSRKIHFASTNKSHPHSISLAAASHKFCKLNPDILVHGGRDNGIKQMRIAAKNCKHYDKTHNDVEVPTSELSAYIKFGCVSIREVYKAFSTKHGFIRQLFWRDFYANILFAFPHVLGAALKPSYNKIKWHHNTSWFNAWTKGVTGFPIVDAGMRQLNATGYMHNRARLITASFLVKTLLISWEKGEQYFAQHLTDYDPASNNGNWQWVAGSGADSQPYFRIFNPWLQLKEYDPECEYVKHWIPELTDVPNKDIFNWATEWQQYKGATKYPKPICSYEEQKEAIMRMYKAAF
jgi:deoxyribodipyrimidine photo-lyase